MSRKSRTVLAVATLAAVAGAGAVALEQAGWWDIGAATTSAPAPATVELHAPVESLLAGAAELDQPGGTTATSERDGAGRAVSGRDGNTGGERGATDGDTDGVHWAGGGDDHESWHHDRWQGDDYGRHHEHHRHHHGHDEDDWTDD
ncbi:hypothetical protein [Georgenia thermotolerans]|uniref:Uncharacterized protein n=1 Tax=Georgenia thermotolerans TaxID=527326 RepID=A0A7J5UKX5_9MICO|nr:hypothetical protein [Georgenia thermotolerans]KAE8763038.1 hypothetical protein GB883_16220 [Georgenia thermotolerans]